MNIRFGAINIQDVKPGATFCPSAAPKRHYTLQEVSEPQAADVAGTRLDTPAYSNAKEVSFYADKGPKGGTLRGSFIFDNNGVDHSFNLVG